MTDLEDIRSKTQDLLSKLTKHVETHQPHASNYIRIGILQEEIKEAERPRLLEIKGEIEKILIIES